MQCPFCCEIRYSKYWKPSQWYSENPITDQFNCCKICSKDGFLSTAGELLDELHRLKTCMNVLKEMPQWLRLFEKWMEMPFYIRKELSYNGGIRRDFHHGSLSYYDAGNAVYGFAMRLMWPTFAFHYQYNDETLGDIFEGILALHYLHGHSWCNSRLDAHRALENYLRSVSQFCKLSHAPWKGCKTFDDCRKLVQQLIAEQLD